MLNSKLILNQSPKMLVENPTGYLVGRIYSYNAALTPADNNYTVMFDTLSGQDFFVSGEPLKAVNKNADGHFTDEGAIKVNTIKASSDVVDFIAYTTEAQGMVDAKFVNSIIDSEAVIQVIDGVKFSNWTNTRLEIRIVELKTLARHGYTMSFIAKENIEIGDEVAFFVDANIDGFLVKKAVAGNFVFGVAKSKATIGKTVSVQFDILKIK